MKPTFDDFWPGYARMHARPQTRWLHACATLLAAGLVLAAVALRNPWLLLAAPLADHLVAQWSHRHFEHNTTRPWLHPLLHARAELKLFALTVTGRFEDAR